ncbi:MAG: Spy/CpxP family protein refolding chaperone [Burkholderiaceae bacterium]|nr:Spy/CpxP family protein refolding chaperone [Burkholderiaceae bacterium]
MKASSSLPALSALALALGVSGAWAQSSATGSQASPAAPAVTPATPPGSASTESSPSTSADSAASDRAGVRYGRGYRAGPGMMGGYGGGMMGGYGPGMMGGGPGQGGEGYGYGPGYGGPGPGYGMGRGGGYGPGPNFGGPGQGYGWGMGHGMMQGPGSGMGPGMMGGYGPGWGMGPWALGSLDLDDAQRKQLRELQQQQRRKHWALMGQMQDEMEKMQDAWGSEPGTRNRAAILAANQRMAELRQQMLESRLDAAEQLDKILTPEQREQLRSQWGAGPGRARR